MSYGTQDFLSELFDDSSKYDDHDQEDSDNLFMKSSATNSPSFFRPKNSGKITSQHHHDPGSLSFQLRQYLDNNTTQRKSQMIVEEQFSSSSFVTPVKRRSSPPDSSTPRIDHPESPQQKRNGLPWNDQEPAQRTSPFQDFLRPATTPSSDVRNDIGKRHDDGASTSKADKLKDGAVGDHSPSSSWRPSGWVNNTSLPRNNGSGDNQMSGRPFQGVVTASNQSTMTISDEVNAGFSGWNSQGSSNNNGFSFESTRPQQQTAEETNPVSVAGGLDPSSQKNAVPDFIPQSFEADFVVPESFPPPPSTRAPEPSREEIDRLGLKPVSLVDERFRSVFSQFSYFNKVQSDALDDVLHSDSPVVISAPTGCGKTVVFELAIIKQLSSREQDTKIIYIAPIKALCSERFNDWKRKFSGLGVNILEMTGDSDESIETLRHHNLIVTTPEKLDSISRWLSLTDPTLMMSFKLIMIDEVHMLNDKDRGHVLEAVVSRFKTSGCRARFIAVSATFPNVEDVALWVGGYDCVFYKFGEEMRPVQLERVVLGFPMQEGQSEFKFEMNLSYKLDRIINQYSRGEPTLIFCNSRKSTMNTASVLSKQMSLSVSGEKKRSLMTMVSRINDVKLRELVTDHSIGYHHAGMSVQDKRLVETMFGQGLLSVLTCTSTLALGVNLPAQLVIIKSTLQMVGGGQWREYSQSQVSIIEVFTW